MIYRHKKRVDWDEEIRKTERIRKRGLITSAFSLALAAAVIISANRFAGVDLSLPRRVLSVACLALACFVFAATMRHLIKIRRERDERRNDKNA